MQASLAADPCDATLHHRFAGDPSPHPNKITNRLKSRIIFGPPRVAGLWHRPCMRKVGIN
jgi:hypothetical protein